MMNYLSRCSIVTSIIILCCPSAHPFSINEVSSHLQISGTNQVPILLNDIASSSSLLSSAAFVPALRPQQAVLSLFNDYQSLLAVHPLPTKLVTGAILAVAGDAVAQSRDKGDYNPSRGASFAAFDVTYRALQNQLFPMMIETFQGTYFQSVVEALGLAQILGNNIDVMAALERALANQLIVVPFFYYPVFFLFSGFQVRASCCLNYCSRLN